MKKTVRILAVAMVAVMLCLVLASCGNKLSGTYSAEQMGIKVSYTFKGDKVTMKAMGTEIEGTYEIKDDEITIKYEIAGEEVEETEDFEKKDSKTIVINGVELTKE